MATSINFPTYGFINDILALNEENWRKFFKPFIYDSVQSGLETSAGTGMTVNISGGECRCGAVMGVLDNTITLDITNGHSTYDRIDSVVVQYSYGSPSVLSLAIKRGIASGSPVAPTLSKVYNTLWEMEIAQILVPAGATSSSALTITDTRVIYDSVKSIIDDNAGDGDTDVVWSADKSYNLKEIIDNRYYSLIRQTLELPDFMNGANFIQGYAILADGTLSSNQLFSYSDLIEVTKTSYTLYWERNGLNKKSWNIRIHGYDEDGNWIKQITSIYNSSDITENIIQKSSFDVTSDIKYIRISAPINATLHFLFSLHAGVLRYINRLTSEDDLHNLEYTGVYIFNGLNHPDNIPFDQYVDRDYRILVIKPEGKNKHKGEFHIIAGQQSLWFESYNSLSNQWEAWKSLYIDDTNIKQNRYLLNNNDDINELPYPGTYSAFVSSDSYPINWPIDILPNGRYRLMVDKNQNLSNHNEESQIIVSNSNIYFRRYSNNLQKWMDWKILYGADNSNSSYDNSLKENAERIGIHKIPSSFGMLNAIKRARQQTDIKWTPASDIPRGFLETGDTYLTSHGDTYMGTFKQGVEYTGLPYSMDHDLGTYYSVDSFITSVANSRSIMIEESSGSSSITPCYYGTVCSNLTSYALNIPTVTSTYWPEVKGMSLIGYINDGTNKLDINVLELADILQIDGHCAIITDIISDQDNNIIQIEISEATRQGNIDRAITDGLYGGIARRITMTVDQFYSWFEGFALLRYQYLSTIPYAPNIYSPMPDEGKPLAYINYPCVPYEGNNSSYSSSGNRRVKILINSTLFNYLSVTKNDEAWNQDGTTNPYNVNGLAEITITCDQDFAIYKANLINIENDTITNSTVSCSWAIRPIVNTIYNLEDNKLYVRCTLTGDSFKPWFITFGNSLSDTNTKVKQGQSIKVFDIYEVIDNGDNTYTYTFNVDYPTDNPVGVRIGIKSDTFGGSSLYTTIS